MKRRNLLLAGLVAVIAGPVLVWVYLGARQVPDPVYQGKSVSYWLSQGTRLPLGAQPDSPATLLVSPKMDSNAVPYLIMALDSRKGLWQRAYKNLWPKLPISIRRHLPAPFDKPGVRGAAAFVLGNMGSQAKPAIPALFCALREDEDPNVRVAALRALRYIGADQHVAMSALLVALKDREWYPRSYAVQALRDPCIFDQAVTDALIISLKDQNQDIRANAVVDLGVMGSNGPAVKEALIKALKSDGDGIVRLSVVGALRDLKMVDEEATDALVMALKDKNSDVRVNAANVLTVIAKGQKAVVAELVRAFQVEEQANARRAMLVAFHHLSKNDLQVTETLIKTLKDKDSGARADAAFALGQIYYNDKVLSDALADGKLDMDTEQPTQTDGAEAERGRDSILVWSALRQALQDEDQNVRDGAKRALQQMGPEAAAKAGVK